MQQRGSLKRLQGLGAGAWPLKDLACGAEDLLGGVAAEVAPDLVGMHNAERRRRLRDNLRHLSVCEGLLQCRRHTTEDIVGLGFLVGRLKSLGRGRGAQLRIRRGKLERA